MLKGKKLLFVLTMMTGFCLLAGCGKNNKDGKTVIELVQYKPEATSYFLKKLRNGLMPVMMILD